MPIRVKVKLRVRLGLELLGARPADDEINTTSDCVALAQLAMNTLPPT
jgi:hypothetical protein